MTEREQRARTLLKEKSALFQNSDDIDYVAAYMAQFAEAEIKREMREVVKGLRERGWDEIADWLAELYQL